MRWLGGLGRTFHVQHGPDLKRSARRARRSLRSRTVSIRHREPFFAEPFRFIGLVAFGIRLSRPLLDLGEGLAHDRAANDEVVAAEGLAEGGKGLVILAPLWGRIVGLVHLIG